jgi:hypothetical protein
MRVRNKETIIKIIPLIPVKPKPGITKISTASSITPAINKIISKTEANSRIYEEPFLPSSRRILS